MKKEKIRKEKWDEKKEKLWGEWDGKEESERLQEEWENKKKKRIK